MSDLEKSRGVLLTTLVLPVSWNIVDDCEVVDPTESDLENKDSEFELNTGICAPQAVETASTVVLVVGIALKEAGEGMLLSFSIPTALIVDWLEDTCGLTIVGKGGVMLWIPSILFPSLSLDETSAVFLSTVFDNPSSRPLIVNKLFLGILASVFEVPRVMIGVLCLLGEITSLKVWSLKKFDWLTVECCETLVFTTLCFLCHSWNAFTLSLVKTLFPGLLAKAI